MEEQETIEPEFEKEINLKKEFELKEENKIYKLKMELDKNGIIFELNLISELSYYNYIKRYNYNDLIKILNLSTNIYNNISKIFNYIELKEFKILDEKRNKKIIINGKDKIILNENKNQDIINILINEINKQNEKINNLIKLNAEKDTKINDLNSKYEELKKELNLISNNKKINKANEENKINFKFNKDKEDLKINIKNAKNICVDDIIIENIGDMKYDKLYFVIDKNESDKDITFIDKKNLYAYQLQTGNRKLENIKITLKIDSPKIDKTYTAYFYIKDNKENSPKLSKPFIINIKLQKEEIDQLKLQKAEANKLYDEYNNIYKLSELCSKEEAIKNFLEFNNAKILIEEWIKIKMEEKEKIKQLYDELNSEFKLENNNFNKNNTLNKFKELNFDKEKIIKWIKSEINKNAEKIYKKLNIPNYINKDEAINKIISENFNEENINKWTIEENLLNLFDEDYSILSIIEEDEIREKIRELDYNKDKIDDWIRSKLEE